MKSFTHKVAAITGAGSGIGRQLAYLLIGPAWLAGKLMRRLHISY